ncbi:MAG: hypothetical protein LBV43_02095 [Prevotella sp.]|nr:hypothetical protein [Prevotella sp.]
MKQHIVEIDATGRIINVFPFEKETENTRFYSGLLLFLPIGKNNRDKDIQEKMRNFELKSVDCHSILSKMPAIEYVVFHDEDFIYNI